MYDRKWFIARDSYHFYALVPELCKSINSGCNKYWRGVFIFQQITGYGAISIFPLYLLRKVLILLIDSIEMDDGA